MKTLAVDKYQRVRLPDAKGGQRFNYENKGNGVLLLTEVREVETHPVNVRFEKKGLYAVGVSTRGAISEDALNEALAAFPP